MSDDPAVSRTRRERSARYPGVPLAESVDLCRFVDEHGLDGLGAAEIATALGYKNAKTNTFSARLSAARQFGLLTIKDEGYLLTALARSILHPVDPDDVARLYRQAFGEPPLYGELTQRLADKRVPEASILANVLYHHHNIIATAKQQAAESFLESARFAGMLGPDGVFRPQGIAAAPAPMLDASSLTSAKAPEAESPMPPRPNPAGRSEPSRAPDERGVRLDLRLWDEDEGKTIRLRAPEAISAASFERFLQAFRLVVRIDDAAVVGAAVEDDGVDEA